MMSRFGQTFHKNFEWKFLAQEFIKKMKKQNESVPKRRRDRLTIKLEPWVSSISSRKFSESRIVGWSVSWSFLPHKKTK